MAKATFTWLKAFNFKVDLSLEELHDYLSERMGVGWFAGSKEAFGDYTSVKIMETGTVIRVFEEEGGFAFDMLNKTGCSEEEYMSELENFKSILEEKGASEFTATEDYY